jgi:osmotically-inducible protein OsmY
MSGTALAAPRGMRLTIPLAVALGATAMYFLDPQQGRRRRAMARDQVARRSREAYDWGEGAARDVAHRARGAGASLRQMFEHRPVTDEQLAARVRARLGRATSHPGAIDVQVKDAQVVLSGAVLMSELPAVVRAVRRVPGVRHVDDQLTGYANPRGVSALQGGA